MPPTGPGRLFQLFAYGGAVLLGWAALVVGWWLLRALLWPE